VFQYSVSRNLLHTSLPSNLSQDHPQMRSLPFMWQRWRLHHSIRHSRKPHAARRLCFIERELLPIKVLHCGNRNFQPFWSLWPWPWSDDLHIRTWPVFPGEIPHVWKWTSYVHSFESYRLTDRQAYINISYRQDRNTMPLRRWSTSAACVLRTDKRHINRFEFPNVA